jgi:hypothetical protein
VAADGDSLAGDSGGQAAAVDLYWLPLGPGDISSGSMVACTRRSRFQRRPACDLYHSALQVKLPGSAYVIEQAPVHDWSGRDRVSRPLGK